MNDGQILTEFHVKCHVYYICFICQRQRQKICAFPSEPLASAHITYLCHRRRCRELAQGGHGGVYQSKRERGASPADEDFEDFEGSPARIIVQRGASIQEIKGGRGLERTVHE